MMYSKYLTPIFCTVFLFFDASLLYAFERDRSIFEYNKRTTPVSHQRLSKINNALDQVEQSNLHKNLVNNVIPPREKPEKSGIMTQEERQIFYEKEMKHPPKKDDFVSEVSVHPQEDKTQRLVHEVEAGPIFYKRKFKSDLLESDGVMSGLQGRYTLRDQKDDHVYRVEGEVSFGQSDSYSQLVGEDRNGSPFLGYDVRGLYGHDFHTSDKVRVTPYTGFGFRFARDKSTGRYMEDINRYFSDITSDSRLFYVPVGIEVNTQLKNKWSLIAGMEFDYVLAGSQKNFYEEHGRNITGTQQYDTQSLEVDGAYGLRGSTRLLRETEKMDFFIEPFFRYYHMPESSAIHMTSDGGRSLWYEDIGLTDPIEDVEIENQTTEVGVKLGLRY